MHLGFEGLVKVRRQSGQQCRVGPVPRGIVLHRLRRLDSGDLAVRRLGHMPPGPAKNDCQDQARDGQSGGPVAREGFGRAGCGGWRGGDLGHDSGLEKGRRLRPLLRGGTGGETADDFVFHLAKTAAILAIGDVGLGGGRERGVFIQTAGNDSAIVPAFDHKWPFMVPMPGCFCFPVLEVLSPSADRSRGRPGAGPIGRARGAGAL